MLLTYIYKGIKKMVLEEMAAVLRSPNQLCYYVFFFCCCDICKLFCTQCFCNVSYGRKELLDNRTEITHLGLDEELLDIRTEITHLGLD